MIDSTNGPTLVSSSIIIVVLLASLFARRLPVASVVKQLLAWIAIFAVAYGLFLFRDDFKAVWARAKADVTGQTIETADSGEVVRVRRSDDGHFWVDASILGHEARFLVDSGATTTVVTEATARESGLFDHRSSRPIVVNTANGTANSWPAGRHGVRIGGHRVEDVQMSIAEDDRLNTNLLGMSFLNRLKGWSVEGNELVLKLP